MIKKYWVHVLLFILTFITATLSGAEWITGKAILNNFDWINEGKIKEMDKLSFDDILNGMQYAIPFLAFLTFHEFGHYFMAKIRKVNVTLPYYLPAWFGITLSIGTFGAFIRIKDIIKSKKDYFDIAIAGPLAGFVVAVICLSLGFSQIRSDEYIFKIHPEYKTIPGDYRAKLDTLKENPGALILGESLLYTYVKETFGEKKYIPHPYETTHYPLIFAGFLGLLFTAINLLPIGQLDGGHILFSMIGKKYFDIVSPTFLVLLTAYGGIGIYKVSDLQSTSSDDLMSYFLYFVLYVYFVYLTFSKIFTQKLNGLILALGVVFLQLIISYFYPNFVGYSGILAFMFLIGRFLGVYHPGVENDHKLDPVRFSLGILAMLIFIACISLHPIS